jgi:hypothetical protein
VGHETDDSRLKALRELEEAATLPDIGAEPGPEDLDFFPSDATAEAVSGGLDSVKWPSNDENAPDYSYVAAEPNPARFTLTADTIETMLRLNRFAPDRLNGVIALGIRGAALTSGNEVEEADEIELDNVRPDHRTFRCVIGYYFTGSRKLSLYTGSTVPCRKAVWGFANGRAAANMLPTGLHTYFVWRHKNLQPALRLGESSEDPETAALAAVLRTKNDTVYGTQDPFDPSFPLDNVHCSYFLTENSDLGASFSSWGCLTVRGEKTPGQQWKKFQATLRDIGAKERVDLLLATGKDMALIHGAQGDADMLEQKLSALRRGSKGIEVERLQERLEFTGDDVDGDFGPKTVERLSSVQRRINQDLGNGPVADGVYSRAMEAKTGWGVFESGMA